MGILPEYRGIGVTEWPILESDSLDQVKIGVTLHLIDRGIDTGPILLQENINIDSRDTIEKIEEKFLPYMVEAMFAGAPVICSNLSSLPEVVGEAAYFLEDPRDPIEMEEAIANVLGDSDLQRDLSAKGREQSKKFSWEKCTNETLEVYKKII